MDILFTKKKNLNFDYDKKWIKFWRLKAWDTTKIGNKNVQTNKEDQNIRDTI